MTDKEKILMNPLGYLLVGDVDKAFHRPECECKQCEMWRTEKGRPTREECRAEVDRRKSYGA